MTRLSAKAREDIEYALTALSRHDPGDCEEILVKLLGYRVKAGRYGEPLKVERDSEEG